MNLRGVRAKPPHEDVVKLNVTSAQRKDSEERIAFSPMTTVEGGCKGFYCFENYWQSGKVFEGVDRDKCVEWMKRQEKPRLCSW